MQLHIKCYKMDKLYVFAPLIKQHEQRTNNIHTGGDAASIPKMERNTSAEDDT